MSPQAPTVEVSNATASRPWQLQMFRRTLKKRKRFDVLRNLLHGIGESQRCLLITCGDNNGAMNYRLRELGGKWSWADLETKSLNEMSALLGDEVKVASEKELPFSDESFDVAIAIDVHEHVTDPVSLTKELHRITKRGGRIIITVPGGDNRKFVNRIKNVVGMKKEEYGHVRDGFSVGEIEKLMSSSSIEPSRSVTFSRFFTELMELAINIAYVKKLSRKSGSSVDKGTIAPATKSQLESVGLAYRIYSLAYPFMWAISKLDSLLFFTSGYVVLVEGRRGIS